MHKASASEGNLNRTAEEVPVITTDKSAYEPGETITFTGANWTPGETVRIALRTGADDGEGDGETLEAIADENGSFVVTATMPGSGEDMDYAPAMSAETDRSVAGNKYEGGAAKASGAASRASVAAASPSAAAASQAGGTIYTATATGTASGASAQTQFKENVRVEEEGEEDDADLPRFRVGKIEKEEYLRRRDEHINKLRGIERGRPFDPGARGRAIRQLEQQIGRPDKDTITNENMAAATSATASAGQASAGGDSMMTASLSASSSAPSWSSVGPAPIPNGQTFSVQHAVSGRVTTIAVHPSNSNIAYVGTAQGGIYRTLDGGTTWTAIFDNAQTLAIGSIAIAPSQPSTIYVGTGEGNFGCDTFFGVGVYRIDNADGVNPAMTGPFNQETGTGADVLTGRSISKVLVHPSDPNTIFIASNSGGIGGIGCDAYPTQASSRGVYRSTNATSANATFQKITTNTANGGNRSATDLEFEPGNPNILWATIYGFSTAGDGGVYRTANALAATPTFTQVLSTGTASATARTEIAINKVGSTVTVYAAITDGSGTVKRTTNNGGAWTTLTAAAGFCGGQCSYDMPIAVDPNNAAILYIGGNADGTSTAILKKSINATGTSPTFAKVQNGLHADSHAIEPDPSNSSTVWFGSDGGVWKSTDAAATWTSLNNTGFNATQFQSIARHPTDANYTIGGTQDNGTERMRPDGTWTRTDYGDGGFALIDQNATNTTTVRQYHTYYNQVGTGGIVGLATTTSSTAFENWSFLGCGGTANGLSCNDTAVEFYAPIALGPGNPNTVYFGTDRLYRSSNSGSTMTVVSQQFVSGVSVSAIGISRQSDAVRIVGLSSGKVYRTMTGGATSATMTDVTGTIPARYVSRVVIDPNNQNTAYVTLAGFFGNSTTAHIYKTTNLNAAAPTWTGLAVGTIPDVPVDAFAVDPADSNYIYAGTDIGVYRSTDGGATWSAFSNGLPRVAVFDMSIHNASRTLRIATHGRGMWDISIAAPVNPGTLQGTVRDAANNPVGGATVTAGANTTTSNASGFYVFGEIAPGSYTVSASAPGYNTNTATGVTVTSNTTTTRDFTLTAAPTSGCSTDTTQADFQAGTSTNVNLTDSPGNVVLASGAASLDQQQTSLGTSGNAITTTTWQAQTFTPATSGRLTQIDAALFCSGCTGTTEPVTVEVRTTSGGVPTSTVLATATIPAFSTGSTTYYAATFSAPPALNAATTYAYVLRMQANPSAGTYAATRSTNNQYANGARVSTTNSGGAWTADTTDLGFRTYISAGYVSSGDLVSSLKDSNPAVGSSTSWTTLSWTATTPANTTVRFQVAGSNNAAGPFNFVGPDGTANTSFNTSGASLAQFSGSRYLKYKAYLSTTSTGVTPVLNDVSLCYCTTNTATSLSVAPAGGTYGGTTTLTATLTSGGNNVSGQTVSFTLNGASVGNATTNGSGIATLSNVNLSGINAGTYANGVGATFATANCYGGSVASNSLTVDKVTPTLVWNNPANITYGTALGASQLNATASVPGSFAYTPAAGTVLDAGNNQTLHAVFTPADTTNYNGASKDVFINVSKASLNVKADNQSRAYGDANPAFTYTMTGFVGDDTQASDTTGQPDINTTANSTSAPGNYAINVAAGTLGATNYAFSFVNGTLTVTKANQTITFGALATKTYGDADFTLNATASSGLPVSFAADGKCTLSGSTIHLNGAGACTITASQAGNGNYNAAANVSQSFNINKADSTTTVTVGNATYDGNPHGGTASTTGFGGLNQNLTVTYQGRNGTNYPASTTAPTEAGDYTASASFDGDGDHNGSSDAKEFQIAKAASTTTVTFEDAPYVYRNSAYTATAKASGVGGLDSPVTVQYGGDCTNVTTSNGCTATATYPGDANHEGSNDIRSITITKAKATIALGDLTQTYSGAPRLATATTNPGNLGGVSLSYNGSADAPTAAGSYTVLASLNNQNYEADNATGTLNIGKAAPVVSATDNNCTYNGAACAGSGTAAGVDGTNLGAVTLTYTPGGSAPVNAGTYTFVASIGETLNHTAGSSAPATITIGRATPTLSASGGTFTYDGSAHPATGFAYGIGGINDVLTPALSFTYNGSSDAPVSADTYAVVASFAGNDNYLPATISSAVIVIGKAPAAIKVDGYTGIYDGQPHGANGSATGVNGEDLTNLLSFGATFTNVPGGTAHWAFAGNTNYAPASGDASIVISKATPNVTWNNPANITYGTALGASQFNATASVPGSFAYTPAAGTVLDAGNNQTLRVDFTPADTTNYNGASKDVTVNVSKASQTIAFGALAGKTYGDAPFNVSATGGASGNPVTYAAAGNCTASGTNGSTITITGAGDCAVTASQSGNANYNAAADVARSFQIAKASATITLTNLYYLYDGTAKSATATTNPNGLSGVTINYTGTTLTYNSTTAPTTAGTYTATASLANNNYAAPSATATFVINAAPSVTINAPASGAFYTKGSTVSFTGAFVDNPGTHTAAWTFTSGTQTITQPASVNEATGAVSASYTFANTGVYTVKLTVTDNFSVTGQSTTVGGAAAHVAIYDPSLTGGSVSTTTKSPLYNSLAGWYPANPALTGTATTGFNASYPSATAAAPTGQAVFNFPAANLSFSSLSYQWMVVTRPHVWLRGSGTVNNVSGYEFLIAAVDGQLTGGGGTDKFRIRIWRKSDGAVVYDNLTGAALGAVATTVTSNGDIAVK